LGFAKSGIPDRPEPLIHRFKFNDEADFFRLYKRHKSDLAAIMIEPAGPWGGDEVGPEPDADKAFLDTIAKAAREANALLVFDEIVTNYRYPQGSVQKATGIVPDLACLGKAIASGMPLSALVGRAPILQQGMPHVTYSPTFKGEIYSLAAAKAAIRIYREEPVAEYVWNHGMKLKEEMNALCNRIGIAAELKGPPFRMALVFHERDLNRYRLKLTLLQQELLKEGVMTYNGIMLPSYAHDDATMEITLSAASRALKVVAETEMKNDFEKHIEIPLVSF
jgi:glutamate-1-semialdehyde aminotransferase